MDEHIKQLLNEISEEDKFQLMETELWTINTTINLHIDKIDKTQSKFKKSRLKSELGILQDCFTRMLKIYWLAGGKVENFNNYKLKK